MTTLILITLLSFEAQSTPKSWWAQYGDADLTQLVETALAKNQDLATATQRIAEARAVTGQAKSRLSPDINFQGSANRLRGGFNQGVIRIPNPEGQQQGGAFVSPFETGLFQGGLDMKWELDFFGRNRRGLEAARADAEALLLTRDDLAITVSAEVARYYFAYRGIEERILITEQNLTAQRELLELTRDRQQAGLATQLDLERQQLLLANTEASLPPLLADLSVQRNRLAVLAGEEQAAKITLRPFSQQLAVPTTAGDIPSELLKRRPDVRAAETSLAAAQFRVRQARTDLFPKISLNGLVGRQGLSLSGLSFGGGNFFNIGPQVQIPIFNGKRIRSQIAAEEARLAQAESAYRQEVLTAIEESANALSNLQRQQEREAKLLAATTSARNSLELSLDLFRAGATDFLTVLDSQRGVYDAEFQRAAAHTQSLIESVALYKALAGEWLR
ncbi:MAG: efflux transporter outer membrane subunit [Bryobacter sp.]|nr:efflux transporter outer membrane subunit [Bryobacter sp.]